MNWFLLHLYPRWVKGATLPPFGIYLRPGFEGDTHLIAHEEVHWHQYQRLGLLRFYTLYLYYSLRYGYTNNPLEIEAREGANHAKP